MLCAFLCNATHFENNYLLFFKFSEKKAEKCLCVYALHSVLKFISLAKRLTESEIHILQFPPINGGGGALDWFCITVYNISYFQPLSKEIMLFYSCTILFTPLNMLDDAAASQSLYRWEIDGRSQLPVLFEQTASSNPFSFLAHWPERMIVNLVSYSRSF